MKRRQTQQSISRRSPSPGLSLHVSPERTAAHRVFGVMDLLLIIFETFNLSDEEEHNALLSAMLTCKHWHKHACMVMWREASCAKLLRLMPITLPLPDTNPYIWAELLHTQHYASLKRYSPYIIRLKHDDQDSEESSWALSAHWVEAFLWNATRALEAGAPIFPKLSTLHWHRNKNTASPDEKEITASRFTNFIGRIVSPRVVSLSIDSVVTPVLPQIVTIIEALPDLQTLSIPVPFDGDAFELFSCVSRLPKLKSFTNTSLGDVIISETLHPTTTLFTPGAFQFLDTLKLQCHLAGAKALITAAHSPVHVKRLAFRIPDLGSTQQVHEFLAIVVEKCPNLKAFRIEFNQDPGDTPSRPWGEKIGFTMLRPLLSLRQIESIEVCCVQDLELSQPVIEEMSLAWPKLTFLRIKSFPTETSEEEPSLTLDALLPLAQRCPNLRVLSLSLHPEPGPLAVVLSSSPSQLPTFKHLERLTFYLSQYVGVTESQAALLLHRMLRNNHTPHCQIDCRPVFLHP
ncbi:hypothetical protein QCA50_017935 [Cerrena zonata]|uniref:F-box domain-containing protein n=1 Tax=Cerrena zonata TaxID=2478898 RepID=A0AAW0FI23_9APHY